MPSGFFVLVSIGGTPGSVDQARFRRYATAAAWGFLLTKPALPAAAVKVRLGGGVVRAASPFRVNLDAGELILGQEKKGPAIDREALFLGGFVQPLQRIIVCGFELLLRGLDPSKMQLKLFPGYVKRRYFQV